MAGAEPSSDASYILETPAYIHAERCWPEVDKYSPCEAACPLHMDVPNYVMAVAQGNAEQALSIIRKSNPLPSVCGYVCHHPCEDECNRKIIDESVAIELLKRYAADHGNGQKPAPAVRTKTEKVAIIGSGPAGLTAAHDLVKKGYVVSVFEASTVPGGILSSAIPDFILPLSAVQSDIDYIRGLGVRIHTGIRIGKDLSLASLRQQGFKAILVAVGLQKGASLKIPGSDLSGVFSALSLLKEVKQGNLPRLKGRVWVIGGGAVAMDAARTALRLGAGEVHIACLESRPDMPAFEWEIESAEKEGVRIHPSLAPQEFATKGISRVAGINFQRVTSTHLDSNGRIHWTLMEGPAGDYAVDADSVIIAIGQAPDMSGLTGDSLELSPAGGLLVDERSLQTSIPGIFAAGDISATGGTVTGSMAAGRRAATSIDCYLSGTALTEEEKPREILSIEPKQVPGYFTRKGAWEIPRLLPKEAVKTFKEVDSGYIDWQAVEEAKRCLNCRMCANCIFERGQLCFETASRLL